MNTSWRAGATPLQWTLGTEFTRDREERTSFGPADFGDIVSGVN